MATGLPDHFVDYLIKRDAQRADRVRDFLDSLTSYERGLVHDVAVMGYVQGLMRDRSEGVPKDSQIMALVIDACFAHDDMYPTVNGDFDKRDSVVEYFVQCQQPDGSWAQCSSNSPAADYIVQQRDAHRRKHPEFTYRLARRTTRFVIEAERTPGVDGD